MPKKPARNAFYFFMKELEPQLRREGRVLPHGMADVAEIAHPRYKMLPPKEKDRFEKMAKDAKARMRGRAGDAYRMDNVGNMIAHRKDPYSELDKRRMQEKKDIIKDWPVGKDLKDVPFYFIHFQTLCKIDEPEECLPCEIAMIEYSIKKGIMKTLHRFIEPGRIMTGYRYTCESHSADTHQIPVENFELADANYTGLWLQIENFINPGKQKDENPPVFCLGASGNYKVVELCLDWIHSRACLREPNRIRKIYELETLFQEIHAHIGNQVSKTQCIDLLTSSEWEYEPNTKCSYHEEKEVKHCSLGIVNRYAYALSDNLCSKQFDVLVTKNHLPMRQELNSFVALPRSAMPVCPNQEARMPPKSNSLVKPRQSQNRVPEARREPEEEYQELRRPRNPEYPGMSGATALPAWGNVVGGVPNIAAENDFPELTPAVSNMSSYPPLGRGMSITDNSIGRGQPIIPQMPSMGRGALQSSSGGIGSEAGMQGLGRGMQGMGLYSQPPSLGRGGAMAMPLGAGPMFQPFNSQQSLPGRPAGYADNENEGDEFDDDEDDDDDDDEIVPLRRPGQPPVRTQAPSTRMADYPATVPLTSTVQNIPVKRTQNMAGRGRGNIMENLLLNGVKPGINIGRGYAPKDWVDDESIGRICKS